MTKKTEGERMNNLQARSGINNTKGSETQHDTVKKVISRRVGPTSWPKCESSYRLIKNNNNLEIEGAK